MLQGKSEVLAQARLLQALAQRCGQAGAMHWLPHFLNVPTFRGKRPVVLLGLFPNTTEISAQNLLWAVLLYEFAPSGIRTGIYSTDDISGYRTVIALAEDRNAVVALAADALLQNGAQIIMISAAHHSHAPLPTQMPASIPASWALAQRPVANTLLLRSTYEATLRTLGKSTRFNMRYYRRRLLRKGAPTFIPDARNYFTASDITALNAASLNPFPPQLAVMQYEACNTLDGGFLLGLRSAEGQWLSLVGGWRHAGTTVLLWQMNTSGFERDSLGTIMRSYFVQHEVERGAERILFYGGTPNSIEHSFAPGLVTDLIVVRSSARARMLSRFATLLGRPNRFMRNPNFIAKSVSDPTLSWHQTSPSASPAKIEPA